MGSSWYISRAANVYPTARWPYSRLWEFFWFATIRTVAVFGSEQRTCLSRQCPGKGFSGRLATQSTTVPGAWIFNTNRFPTELGYEYIAVRVKIRF
jgi:hypothetical protein